MEVADLDDEPERGPTRRYNNKNIPITGNNHLIADINFAENWVVCRCDWRGAIDEWGRHRYETWPPDRRRR